MQLIEKVILHGVDLIVIGGDDEDNMEMFILNVSINEVVENMEKEASNSYTKVMDFLKKVWILMIVTQCFLCSMFKS